jgi:iron complex outermembrane receptor protein
MLLISLNNFKSLAVCVLLLFIFYFSSHIQAKTVQFNITSSSLNKVLLQIAEQANMQLVMRTITDEKPVNAINQVLSLEGILTKTLKNTSLTFQILNDEKVILIFTKTEKEAQETSLTADELWQFENIVVTATKRPTNMMDTPLAVTALSQEMLDNQNLNNVKDIAKLVPGMDIGFDTSQQAPVISMRGVRSSNVTEWGDPAVGLHTDGIYSPRPQGAMALMFDVNRVEALRGPQGTLYGRNSNAGAINIITNAPSMDKVHGNIEATFGKWSLKKYKGFINVPVSDTFALRGSFVTEIRDSYMDGYYSLLQYDQRFIREMGLTSEPYDVDFNYDTQTWEGPEADMLGRFNGIWWMNPHAWGRDGEGSKPQKAVKADPSKFYNNTDQYAFRAAALWAPSDDFSWQVTYEQFQDNSAGSIDSLDCSKLKGRMDTQGNVRDCSYYYAEIGGGDEYTALVNIPGHLDMSIDSVRSKMNWDISSQLSLIYNYGFADQERTSWGDRDIGAITWDMAIYFPKTDYESYSHELQVNYTGDNWVGILGYFNFKEQNAMHGFWDDAYGSKTMWLQPERSIKSQAIFAQLTYDITDDLHLTFGARHTKDTKEDKGGANYRCETEEGEFAGECVWFRLQYDGGFWDGVERDLIPSDYYFNPDLENIWTHEIADSSNIGSWNSNNFRFGLDYDYNDDTMVYGYIADGFKSGGFDDKIIRRDGSILQTSFQPEKVITYEFGIKTALLDNQVNLSVASFYTDYNDMQLAAPIVVESWQEEQIHPETGEVIVDETGEPILINRTIYGYPTQNIAGSVIKGVEVEFDWAVTYSSRFSGYVTWTSAKVTSDFINRFNYEPVELIDDVNWENIATTDLPQLMLNQKGFDLPVTPEFSVNLHYYYDLALTDGAVITPRIDIHWESESYLTLWNVDKAAQQLDIDMDKAKFFDDKRAAWHNVDLAIKYTSNNGNYYIEAYVNNVTNENVQLWGDVIGAISKGLQNEPRAYGVRLGYSW